MCHAMTKIMDNHPRHFKDVAGEPIKERPFQYNASFVFPGAVECVVTIDERNEDDPETEYYCIAKRWPASESAAYEKAYYDMIEVVKTCDFFLYWKEKDYVKFPTDKVPLADQAKYRWSHYEWGHHIALTVGLKRSGENVELYLIFDAWH